MDMLLGMGILLSLLGLVFMVMCGYAGAVDWVALLLHRHAEQVRRMHARHNEQLRIWWRAEWPRGRSAVAKGPVVFPTPRRKGDLREVTIWPLSAATGSSRLSSTNQTPAKPKRTLQSPQPH
jgi:hypothetical protein